jgi:DNA repair protein RecO (recombination protein O)
MRTRLGDAGQPLAWTLRRFEAALLDALGVGLDYANDADGQPVDPAARYRLDPEQGLRRLLSDRGRADRSDAATGLALLGLAADGAPPGVEDLAGLRRALRPVLLHHLGGRPLRSWDLLGALGRVGSDMATTEAPLPGGSAAPEPR